MNSDIYNLTDVQMSSFFKDEIETNNIETTT